MERYFTEPYRFVPPYRGTLWCWLLRRAVPWYLRRNMGVARCHFEGIDHLRGALDRQAGILLAANHCRWPDPLVLGLMAWQARCYLYYLASYHLFRQGRFMGWLLNRIGGYSIWREGSDREALRVTAALLARAERPVVLFPEGTWFRRNDQVGPLQEGLSLIVRQAARQSDRPIVVLPVGMKYWMLHDPRPEVARRVERLERSLGWQPQRHLDLVERLEKLGSGLVALKEVEYLGEARAGPLDDRLAYLVAARLDRFEDQYLGRRQHGLALERIRRLRQLLARRLLDGPDNAAVKSDLDVLLWLENLNAHSLAYLRDCPSPERLVETIQRIEETISDGAEAPVVPMGAAIRIGPPIDVRTLPVERNGQAGDSLVARLRGALQGLVDELLAQGPPPAWGVKGDRPAAAHEAIAQGP